MADKKKKILTKKEKTTFEQEVARLEKSIYQLKDNELRLSDDISRFNLVLSWTKGLIDKNEKELENINKYLQADDLNIFSIEEIKSLRELAKELDALYKDLEKSKKDRIKRAQT